MPHPASPTATGISRPDPRPQRQLAASPVPAVDCPSAGLPAAATSPTPTREHRPPAAASIPPPAARTCPLLTLRPPAVSRSCRTAPPSAAPTGPPSRRARKKPARPALRTAPGPDKGTATRPEPRQAPNVQPLLRRLPLAWPPAPPRPGRARGLPPRTKATSGSARPNAPASSRAVSLRAVRLMPRSRSLTERGLRPADSASSSCVSLASTRSCRSNPANPSTGCSAMVPASLRRPIRPGVPGTALKDLKPRLSRPEQAHQARVGTRSGGANGIPSFPSSHTVIIDNNFEKQKGNLSVKKGTYQ